MKTKVLLFALWGTLNAAAQLPTDFRSEQIYLNLHQTSYQPGDTLLLEGQVTCMAEDRFLPYSNYLYIECFNRKDSVLVRQKVSCKDNGYFSTYLPTEYEWPADVYYLRAYTRLMQNFSYDSFAQQPFLLGKNFPKKEEQAYEARCTIVPSGGKLVADHLQTVAVLLTDECTYPVSAELMLSSEKGDTLSMVKTSGSGMAQLRFIPALGMNYYLKGNIDGRDYQFPLPQATQDTKVQGSLNGKRLNYQILNGQSNGYTLYTYDRTNGMTRTNIERNNGIILLNETPEVLTLFLTDESNRVVSEYTLAKRVKREQSLQLPDTLQVNESIKYNLPLPAGIYKVMERIAPENDLLASAAEAQLKYLSDYTSALPFPHHLYAADEAEFNNDFHTWLSTAQFQRFKLADALEKDTAMYVHTPELVLSFSGRIEKRNKFPMKDGQLIAYHTSKDYVYDVSLSNDSARFVMAVDDFLDGEEFYLQAITAKGVPDFANYLMDEESYPGLKNNKPYKLPFARYAANTEVIIGNVENLSYTVDKDNLRNYTLPNTTVKARLRTEKPKETHEFYSSNYISREKIEERPHRSLFEILQDMQGITVEKKMKPSTQGSKGWDIVYSITSNRGSSFPFPRENNTIPILVDGVRFMEYEEIMNMNSFEIESVQYVHAREAIKYTFGAIDGAIIVKTRKYTEKEPLPSKGADYKPTGLSPLSHPYKEIPTSSLSCSKPGCYRLLVDVITESGVQSYERLFNVVE